MSEAIVFYSSPMSRVASYTGCWRKSRRAVPLRGCEPGIPGSRNRTSWRSIPWGKCRQSSTGSSVTECGAICAYLADAFPAARLAPPVDSPLRGTYYRWLFFGGTCVEAAVIDRMLSRPPASRPGALGYGSYDDTVATLERALTPGPYILGPQFSAADVYVGSQIGFGMMMKALEPRPAFKDYLDRVQERPAYKRFMEKSDQIATEMKKAG